MGENVCSGKSLGGYQKIWPELAEITQAAERRNSDQKNIQNFAYNTDVCRKVANENNGKKATTTTNGKKESNQNETKRKKK